MTDTELISFPKKLLFTSDTIPTCTPAPAYGVKKMRSPGCGYQLSVERVHAAGPCRAAGCHPLHDVDACGARHVVHLVLVAALLGADLEEPVGAHVLNVDGLRRAAARAEHEVDEVVVGVEREGLVVPLLAVDGLGVCNPVAGP